VELRIFANHTSQGVAAVCPHVNNDVAIVEILYEMRQKPIVVSMLLLIFWQPVISR